MNLAVLRSIHFPEAFSCFIDRVCVSCYSEHTQTWLSYLGPGGQRFLWILGKCQSLQHSPLGSKRTTKDTQIHLIRVRLITVFAVSKENLPLIRFGLLFFFFFSPYEVGRLGIYKKAEPGCQGVTEWMW